MESKHSRGRGRALWASALTALALAIFALLPGAAGASVGGTALIDGESVTTFDGITRGETPVSLEQWAAEEAGYNVTVRSGEEWEKMTAAEFAQYQVLIIGDPKCSSTALSAVESAPTWTPVVMGSETGGVAGNRVTVGTDPEYHYFSGHGGAQPTNPAEPQTAGAEHLVQDGIAYAGGITGATGVYFTTSCTDIAEPGTAAAPAHSGSGFPQETLEGPDGRDITDILDHLTVTGPGNWTEDVDPPCGGEVAQITSTPFFSTGPTKLLDSDIQGWGCSTHIAFKSFPADWFPLGIDLETEETPTCGTDVEPPHNPICGEAYILLAGSGVTSEAPDLTLTPKENKDTAGGNHSVVATAIREPELKLTEEEPRKTVPSAGTPVTFVVTETNAGVAGTCTTPAGAPDPGCTTDENGQVVFTYHDVHGVGNDTITAAASLERTVETHEEEIGASPAAVKHVQTTERATAAEQWVAPAPVTPISAVLPAKVAKAPAGKASIASVRGCVAQSSYLASVKGSSMKTVKFQVNGKTVKTVQVKTGATKVSTRISLPAGSTRHLTIKVQFTSASGTAAKTFHRTIARCAAHVAKPRFTG
jgi:hypothetical protein